MLTAEINITKEQWEKMNSYEKDQLWYNDFKHLTRKEFKNYIIALFAPAPQTIEQTEQAKYIQTVYRFKNGKVLHCGIYEEISGGILNNIFTALKWKYPSVTIEETETILKSII